LLFFLDGDDLRAAAVLPLAATSPTPKTLITGSETWADLRGAAGGAWRCGLTLRCGTWHPFPKHGLAPSIVGQDAAAQAKKTTAMRNDRAGVSISPVFAPRVQVCSPRNSELRQTTDSRCRRDVHTLKVRCCLPSRGDSVPWIRLQRCVCCARRDDRCRVEFARQI
jgi:hypothetical protein